mmetsp:Transcript_21258/g.73199  ORF Transcript_21258/g.73199 Transcript_21258/m.73199 type:complete len:392 (-) Transcript_21258:23-1198(-)
MSNHSGGLPAAEEPSRLWLASLILGFALGMLLMEVLLEMLFSLPDVPQTIALWNSTVSFACCAIVPVVLSAMSDGGAFTAGDASSFVLQGGHGSDKGSAAGSSTLGLARQWMPFVLLSVLQFAASFAANHAVHFVDFTVKVVFKASKLLPTMAVSTLVGNTRAFRLEEYAAAALLCSGTALFSQGSAKEGHGSVSSADAGSNVWIGAALLAFAVLLEGATSNGQQLMMQKVSADALMLRMNALGAVGGFAGLVLAGDLGQLLAFSQDQPTTLPLLVGAGFSLATSVACYVRLLREVGSVFATIVSTLRKSVTVLLSFVLFPGKAFTPIRALGLAVVLAGVLLAERSGARARGKKAPPSTPPQRCRTLARWAPAPTSGPRAGAAAGAECYDV